MNGPARSLQKARVALACTFALCLGPAVAAEPLARYHNDRFDYTVDYPADLLVPQGEAGNGDGQVFKAKAGPATLTVFGQYLMEEIRGQCDASVRAKRLDIRYKVRKPNLSVASGYRKPDMVFYFRQVKAGDTCLTLELEYPVAERATYDSLVTRISMH